MEMQKYIAMTDYVYGWHFEEPPVSKEDLAKIFPLSKDYCEELWKRYITNSDEIYCLPQLWGKEHWARKLSTLNYNFIDDFNNNVTTNFIEVVRKHFHCSNDDTVLFIGSKFNAIETTFDVFLRNWMNFLYDDEDPLLFNTSTGFAILFASSGDVYGGKRPNKER